MFKHGSSYLKLYAGDQSELFKNETIVFSTFLVDFSWLITIYNISQ